MCLEGLPRSVASRLAEVEYEPLGGGGSAALSFRVGAGSQMLFLKVASTRFDRDVIDGHESASLVKKWIQMRRIERDLPALRAFYPSALWLWREQDFVAYATEFIRGPLLGDLVQRGAGASGLASLAGLLGDQRIPRVACVNRSFYERFHFQRVHRRISYLNAAVQTGEVFHLRVNGLHPLSPSKVSGLASSAGARTVGTVHSLWYPVHGDLNLGNVIMDGPVPRLVDVRGMREWWDVSYDLGKVLFDLLLFRPLSQMTYDAQGRDLIAFRERPAPWAAAQSFIEGFSRTAGGAWLSHYDPLWQQRTALCLATHMLAESAARVSVARVAGDPLKRHLHAAAMLWNIGGHLLDDVLRSAEGPLTSAGRVFEAAGL